MVSHENGELHAAIVKLRDCDGLEIDDALALAETSIRALTQLASGHDIMAESKIDEIASRVSRLKTGISELQANHLRHCHIPEAGLELEATMEATESAASRIMESAEAIMEADPSDADAFLETVNTQVIAIFEACAFQDITGQRISKVRENLNSIETRVARFADVVGVGVEDSSAQMCAEETKREKRKKDQILNGPAQKGEGVDQDAVDAMFD